jgi:predicted glycoside hydrolase/deacetylase ChbG (UPF0249 family)
MSKTINQSKRIVINADDFGLHEAVNEGIVLAHQQGVVTSASLMACGIAFKDAIEKHKLCPALDLGIHLTLVEERPVAPIEKISSLVSQDGSMPGSYGVFARRWLTGQIRKSDVVNELEAQIHRVLNAEVHPSHLDSHQHVHCLPGIWKITLELARKYKIPYVRLPVFDHLCADATVLRLAVRVGVNFIGMARRTWGTRSVKHADHVRGFSFSGHMTPLRLLSILNSVEPGLTEVMVHPGMPDPDLRQRYAGWGGFGWYGDLQALTDTEVLEVCRRGDFVLCNFLGEPGR